MRYVIVDVNAVSDRPLVIVLHHQILIEKAEGLFGWSSGETDEMGIEVFQYLAPEVVNGTVTLVGDDDIESVDWDCRVVFYRRRFFEQRFQTLDRSLVGFLIQLLSLEHRIEALNRADANARASVERVRGQTLDDIFLVEFIVVVGRHILLKLRQRLFPQVASINHKQNPLGAGEFDQTVAQNDREERFTRAGGHLHERARPVIAQGLLDVHDRLRLGRPKIIDQRRHVLQARQQSALAAGVIGDRINCLWTSVLFHQVEQRLRTMKDK